jgi:hypothetical protein
MVGFFSGSLCVHSIHLHKLTGESQRWASFQKRRDLTCNQDTNSLCVMIMQHTLLSQEWKFKFASEIQVLVPKNL